MKAALLLAATFLRLYLRDRLAVALSLLLMVFMMVLFGLAMGDEQFQVVLPVAVLDQAGNPASQRALAAITKDDLLSVSTVATSAEMDEAIRRARVIAGLVLKPGFGGADAPALAGSILVTSEQASKWQRIGIERLHGVLARSQGSGQATGWQVDAKPIAVVKNRYIDFIFPGMLAMAVMQACLGSGAVLLQAKKMGILRRLRLTPVSNATLLGGFLSGRLLIVLLHLVTLSAVAVFGFGAQIQAGWLELAVAISLGALTFMTIGVTMAVIAPSFEAGNMMVQLFAFPMTFLCGIFFKIETIPHYLAWLPQILPLTYLVTLVRGMVNLGAPLSSFPVELKVLTGWLVLSGAVALVSLRYLKRDEM